MSLKTTVYMANGAGEPINKTTHKLPALDDDEVELEMIASGVCFSDIDALSGKYGARYTYPMVAGHEGVGKVTKLGKNVKHLAKGDIVGAGCFRGSCDTCLSCRDEKDHACTAKVMMFANQPNCGTFSEHMRIKSKAVYKIPSAIPPEFAGPLMCAGITTYAPFVTQNVRPGQKVAILGLGGLGHLSVQWARAWGCHVTVYSGGSSKKDLAMQLGAHDYVDTSVEGWHAKYAGTQDFVMNTASGGNINFNAIISTLAPRGKLVIMGVPGMGDIPINFVQLLLGERSIVGSGVGSAANHMRMLEFAAQHNVRPMIEKFKFSEINDVIAKVKEGKVRFRAVMVHEK